MDGKVQAQPIVATAPRSLARRLLSGMKLVAVNFLVFAVLAEVASIVVVHLKAWPSSRPTYHLAKPFWRDTDPAFGIWHYSNGTFFHQGACFSAVYHTNSYGARDIERTLHSSQSRTVVLGDSFMEGYDSSDAQRLTNLLEQKTGREHLNFGTSGGFSPLQYALLYRTLASGFDHNLVLVGVFPGNDFHEMDGDWLSRNYAGQYRPYYAQDFSVRYMGHFDPHAGDSLWDRAESVLRAYLASYHVGQYIYGMFLYSRTQGSYSGYNDYSDVDLARLKKALVDIRDTAATHHAAVAVVLIPDPRDFDRKGQKGANRLGPVLEAWGPTVDIRVKDLLPVMQAQSNGSDKAYFLPCDVHWSPHGSETVAGIITSWLYPAQNALPATQGR